MRGQTSSPSSSSAALLKPPATPAGLVYVTDDKPGFTRVKRGEHFAYRDTQGKFLKDKDEIQRIRKLAIPPAYTRVWICPLRNGHLQATGRDARGRKQYRYHAGWREKRDESKFDRMEAFGLALPRIRARVASDLKPVKGKPLGRTLVLATLVRLLDTTFIRVGNDEYTRDNGSFGLTTLRNPHASVRGNALQLRFRGKSGVMQNVKLDDPKVAAVVRRCQQLPGQELFQYEDENGQPRTLGSSDVNDYLAEIAQSKRATGDKRGDEHFTAKDFRTWHGTVQALELTRLACSDCGTEPSSYSAKAVLAEVAGLLGNTPAVCRKSYIHPAVMALGADLSKDAEAMGTIWDTLAAGKKPKRLYIAEGRLLAFLKNRRKKVRAKA
ncbi:MAG: DNA topoisomerase IB [Polaromonas sp.]|nr:DNA topoisomerase IB [Polaromonas sp.]